MKVIGHTCGLVTETVTFVNAKDLFSGFEAVYDNFFCRIETAQACFLTLSYVDALKDRMEARGVKVPKKLAERFAKVVAANPSMYVDLEPVR